MIDTAAATSMPHLKLVYYDNVSAVIKEDFVEYNILPAPLMQNAQIIAYEWTKNTNYNIIKVDFTLATALIAANILEIEFPRTLYPMF